MVKIVTLAVLMFTMLLNVITINVVNSHTPQQERTTVQPYCPTEDSCQPMYANGTWTIKEIVP